jgi:hypothetical protein
MSCAGSTTYGFLCVCVCVCARAHQNVRVRVGRVCVGACVLAYMYVFV